MQTALLSSSAGCLRHGLFALAPPISRASCPHQLSAKTPTRGHLLRAQAAMLLGRRFGLGRGVSACVTPCRHKSESAGESSSQYCLDLVKKFDYEGFVSALLLPDAPQRTTAIALRAFNVELALVAQKVSNAVISQGRLTFWQDCLDKTSGVPHHPVALELHRARSRHKLSKVFLQRLLSSRRSQIDKPGHESLSELEQYAEDMVSPLLYLTLQSAGAQDLQVDHAASHVGKAIGLTYALRGLAQARGASELAMPRALLLKHRVSQEKLLRGRGEDKEVQDAVFEVASCAKSHLDKARSIKVPKELNPYLLLAVSADAYLDKLQRTNFDPYHPRLQSRFNTLPFTMWFNKFRGRF